MRITPNTKQVLAALLTCTAGGWLCAGIASAENLAPLGMGLMGTTDTFDGSNDTPVYNAGTAANLNDTNLTTRVDSYGGFPGVYSYVGITWDAPVASPVARLELSLAIFFDGGWFGVSGYTPGSGRMLSATNLTEPDVQISHDGGYTWTTVPHTSDYLKVLTGHPLPAADFGPPTTATSVFWLTNAANPQGLSGFNAIRVLGTEGGVASDGFLGVFELAVHTAYTDANKNGLADEWETQYFGQIGADPQADPDQDGLTNLKEFQAGTDPTKADTDTDGLSDSEEVDKYHTNPLKADSDADTLSDSNEVNKYHTDPLKEDTDADGFSDGLEVALGSDPLEPGSIPTNIAIAPYGTAIIGTAVDFDGTQDTPYTNAGSSPNVNDGKLTTRVDTWNNAGVDPNSYVGILWAKPQKSRLVGLKLTLAIFGDGGWFGPNSDSPGWGQPLTADYLSEPIVQVTTNGGASWSEAPHTSDYLTNKALIGHVLGTPNPSSATVLFTLTNASNPNGVTGVNGIRVIGGEGGAASGGFLGVFELETIVAVNPDTDNNGFPDVWERLYFNHLGVDPKADTDNDGLTNLQEFQLGTDPGKADTDGDGLTDGDEVNKYHTDPLKADTDGDGLNDGDEVNKYGADPLKTDTDGDGFTDGNEANAGANPASAASYPDNIAPIGAALLGTGSDTVGSFDTPFFNSAAGALGNVNDGVLTNSVDTFGPNDPNSYVGISWASITNPVTAAVAAKPIVRLELTLATFFDGGWFGNGGVGPGSGQSLTAAEYLLEPEVQASSDGGVTWTPVTATSDYMTALDGHPLPAVDFGAPTAAMAVFTLTNASNPKGLSGYNAIRIIGSEGGTASGGFLGVFELAVRIQAPAVQQVAVTLRNVTRSANGLQFEFQSQAGATHAVQFKPALTDANWQILTNVAGDGALKIFTDTPSGATRFYRVTSQ